MVHSVCRWFNAAFLAAGFVILETANVQANPITINPGYDEMKTQTAYFVPPSVPPSPPNPPIPFTSNPLTTFNFGGSIGSQYVGDTDTIIQRTDASFTLANNGDHHVSAITVAAISLKTLDGSLFATLNLNNASTGTIDIERTSDTGGIWTNDFTVHIDIFAASTGTVVYTDIVKHFTGYGTWATTPGPYNSETIIAGVNQNNNFWITGPAHHEVGDGTVHVVESIQSVPEPSSVALLMSGSLIVGYFAIQRKKASELSRPEAE